MELRDHWFHKSLHNLSRPTWTTTRTLPVASKHLRILATATSCHSKVRTTYPASKYESPPLSGTPVRTTELVSFVRNSPHVHNVFPNKLQIYTKTPNHIYTRIERNLSPELKPQFNSIQFHLPSYEFRSSNYNQKEIQHSRDGWREGGREGSIDRSTRSGPKL